MFNIKVLCLMLRCDGQGSFSSETTLFFADPGSVNAQDRCFRDILFK